MQSMYAPMDPIFYSHHAMVDKVWQDWYQQDPQNRHFEDPYPENEYYDWEVSRYSNTTIKYNIYGDEVPSWDFRNNSEVMDDSRLFGIFYSDKEVNQVTLDGGYSVTNNNNSPEYFYYKNKILAGDFSVPSGKSAVIHSSEQIVIRSGFISKGNLKLLVKGYSGSPAARKAKPIYAGLSTSSETNIVNNLSLKVFQKKLTIKLNGKVLDGFSYEVFDLKGRKKLWGFADKSEVQQGVFGISVETLEKGVHYIMLMVKGKNIRKRFTILNE